MEWISSNSGALLIFLGGFVGLLALLGIGVLAMIWIGRGLRRLAEVQLSIAKVKQEQAIVRAATRGDQVAALRSELKETEVKLREATILAKAREKLLVAQDENLTARARTLATGEKDTASAQRRATEANQRAEHAMAEAAQVKAELEQLRTQSNQLEQAAGLIQRQLEGQQQNAAMLQTTVSDLNAKRDLLTAEVRHLQERLEQETALRGR